AEQLLAWELGYRRQVTPRLAVDVASFLNKYRRLASLELGEPFTDPQDGGEVYPIMARNMTRGRAVGAEALVNFSPTDTWRLTASYSFVHLSLHPRGMDLNRDRFAE